MANSKSMNPAYVIPVWETITAAWEKTKGAKTTIWAALGVVIIASILLGALEGMTKNTPALCGLITFIGNIVIYFMQIGLLYMGIRRAADAPIEWKMVFTVLTDFNKALWIVAAYLIMFLVYIPPMILIAISFVLMGISTFLATICFIASFLVFFYLTVRLILTIAYILDTNKNAWEAVKASFYATQDNVLPLIGIVLLQAIIIMVSALPLGIGLIWTLPFAFILYGTMYQRLRVNVT